MSEELSYDDLVALSADLWTEMATAPSYDERCKVAELNARRRGAELVEGSYRWADEGFLAGIVAAVIAEAERVVAQGGASPIPWDAALAELDEMAADTSDAETPLTTIPDFLRGPIARFELAESWLSQDLAAVLAGDLTSPAPTVFDLDVIPRRSLFYKGAVNGVHGDSGIGKSWVAAIAIAQELQQGHDVMLLDWEDTAVTFCNRLLALGVRPELIATLVDYRRPMDRVEPLVVAELVAAIKARHITLVVSDSLGEAFGVQGVDENADKEVAPFLRLLVRPLADAGAAVLIIDHSTKSKENPLHPSGSKRKRAAFTGASYLVTSTSPPVKATGAEPVEGRLTLTCAKDRHGTYRQGTIVASVVITSYPDGGVTAHVWPPTESAAGAEPLPIILAARAATKAAKDAGRPLSMGELEELTNIKARAATKRAGITSAVAGGFIGESSGSHGARIMTYITDVGLP